jgi:dTDP-4-dehydrorhamnose reductase
MIVGSAGQLGSTITTLLGSRYEVHPLTRAELDITDEKAVIAAATAVAPDIIINCAAYNNVDGAEENALAALSGNSMGTLALSRAAALTKAVFVHYSTDFVFDGQADAPYTENQAARPLSTYGASKLLGEWFALESPEAYVLRVESLFGGQPAKSSIDKIAEAIRDGRQVRVFSDRTVTPSYVDDVSAATVALLSQGAPFGLYHCVNSGVTTWLGVAQEVARILRCEANILPVTSDSVQLKAKRPLYCALSNQKLTAAGFEMPSWTDALRRYLSSTAGTGVAARRASG